MVTRMTYANLLAGQAAGMAPKSAMNKPMEKGAFRPPFLTIVLLYHAKKYII